MMRRAAVTVAATSTEIGRFTAVPPTKPQVLLDIEDLARDEAARLRRAGHRGLAQLTARVYASALLTLCTEAEKAEVADYNRRVRRYNDQVHAYRARVRAAQVERRVARERAAVQAARCDRCFTVHGSGQVECW